MQAEREADRLLDGLDPAQRRAVTAPEGPVAILAGAGSGKTRVLTRRIAYRTALGTVDPRHVLALTFTRRAAGELRRRLGAMGLRDLPTAGTFHAVAYAQLRGWWTAAGRREPTLLDRKGRVLARVLPAGRGLSVVEAAAEVEWARARGLRPDTYAEGAASAGRRVTMPLTTVAEVFAAYEEHKRRKGLVDFDDLLEQCAVALETDAEFARGQRWRFRHLFVDEYQDVNPLQHRLLRAWLGDGDDLCVVGDADQAIYGWNGADAGFLVDFADEHPGATVVALDRNHRSSAAVVAAATAVLPGRTVVATGDRSGPVPTITAAPDDLAEAVAVARAARTHHRPGRPWSDQAVLVRTNAQTALIEQALRRARIPFRVRGAAPFLDRPGIADALSSARRSAGRPLRAWLADLAAAVGDSRAAVPEPTEVGPEPDPTVVERLDALDALVRLGHDLLDTEPDADVAALAPWLSSAMRAEDGDDRTHDSVDIVTFHAAKGLEWKVVHVAGLEDGYVPIAHARTTAARHEERRLLYVALTRAEDVLCLYWAAQRTFGERTVARTMSPWLPAVADALAARTRADRGLPTAEGHARAREAHRVLDEARAGGHRPVDDARTETPDPTPALRRWRAQAARAAGVPEAVVLADRALLELARRRPRDLDALVAVPGLGRLKAERYADELLSLVGEGMAT